MSGLQVSRLLVLSGYFGLFILLLLWITLLAPPTRVPVSLVLLLFVGPLLFPLRGLLYRKRYTHAWTAFLVLIYFTHGVVEAWSNPAERWLAVAEITLSLMLLTGCVWFVRADARKNAS
ncbi:MAG: DUF2069 domain-containing protein [Gammaproteobacteria bacterium]|nr:DUF2069 domain-containing protein [Gammaproteobacteria bacterium]MDH5650973.1 DUF2069 domain-containing protein [Gammaproteobacteria bacterium]